LLLLVLFDVVGVELLQAIVEKLFLLREHLVRLRQILLTVHQLGVE
jgi:hypothetical protein